MSPNPHICMLAAENDAIPGSKVGGIGDVIRDIPMALAGEGATVSVLIPAYNAFHLLPSAKLCASLTVRFRNTVEEVQVFELYADKYPGVRHLVLHHPLFGACGPGAVYCNDDHNNPFATDANKFALFSAAALQAIADNVLPQVDVLHLHDWHAALAAVLIEYDPHYAALKNVPLVFSIHNLALQGIRPLAGHTSSLEHWFPELRYDSTRVADPRWPDCINPVAAAVRLAGKVHTVSPSYALEILQPNSIERGFHGGEGLEADLQQAAARHALVGIINGIYYTETIPPKTDWHTFMSEVGDIVLSWIGQKDTLTAADYVAHQRSQQWLGSNRPAHVVTSVGRLTTQKMALLLEKTKTGGTVLDDLLTELDGRGVFILLGSGDKTLETLCQKKAAQHKNFLFLNSYEARLSDLIFSHGDLFLMPSSFEPCGISQMLAMRAAQPCLVHAVGGLKDTVADDTDGFSFSGDTVEQQVSAMLMRFNDILTLREQSTAEYRRIAQAAKAKRFHWQQSAEKYLTQLYQS